MATVAASQVADPQIPLEGQIGLWGLSAVLLGLLVAALISLMRSPLDEHRRLPWLLTLFILPGIGPAIWLWWRYWYYPRRLAETPDWDPNRRQSIVNAPRRPRR